MSFNSKVDSEEWRTAHLGFQKNTRSFERRFMRRRIISSYGIILFTVVNNDNNSEILFQTVQRRDSISYAEFLKDNLPIDLIKMHINLMSKEERKRCIDYYLKNDP